MDVMRVDDASLFPAMATLGILNPKSSSLPGKRGTYSPISANISYPRCLFRLFSFRRSVETRERGGRERRGRKAISTTESRGRERQRRRREETAAAIGFSLMLIERVTAIGDVQSGLWSRVSGERGREDEGRKTIPRGRP